ncbi:MAG TPA: hypothetical protein PLL10_00015, partial [Elusimicrobiales bacterium]|nr:hypothetical protein [Elusimicrobiales bacterium]
LANEEIRHAYNDNETHRRRIGELERQLNFEQDKHQSYLEQATDLSKKVKKLEEQVDILEIDNMGHAYSLNIVRRACGLNAGESYQEVYEHIEKLEAVVEAARYYADDSGLLPATKSPLTGSESKLVEALKGVEVKV